MILYFYRKYAPYILAMNIRIEHDLITRVRDYNDSDALQQLVRKYQPMVDRMFKMYWLNGYDRNDWYQESYIVCYETCQRFDGSHGSRFANFFKMRFNNHIISLIRAQRAVKRQANNGACSYEDLVASGDSVLDFFKLPAPSVVDLVTHFEILIEDLSDLELAAFRIILGDLTDEEVYQIHGCDEQQLMRASSRCKAKLRKKLSKV